jgi:hypothetical protein
MTNVERLAQVGMLHPGHISDEQTDIINNQMSDQEIEALLSTHAKLGGVGTMHGSHDGIHSSLF